MVLKFLDFEQNNKIYLIKKSFKFIFAAIITKNSNFFFIGTNIYKLDVRI